MVSSYVNRLGHRSGDELVTIWTVPFWITSYIILTVDYGSQALGNSRSIGCKACAAVGCGVCTATMDVDSVTHWKNVFNGQDHHMAEHILAMCLTNTSARYTYGCSVLDHSVPCTCGLA